MEPRSGVPDAAVRVGRASRAFTLLNELEGLIDGIAADGTISESEIQRVRAWMDANRASASVHPFREVFGALEEALRDGRLTEEECADLKWLCAGFTRVNPYFDQLRSGLQSLHAILAGIAADGQVGQAELVALQDWLEERRSLAGIWPYDECCAVVTQVLADGTVTPDEQALVLSLASQLPVGGATPDGEPAVIGGVCAVDPEITFEDRRSCFTGESAKASRADLEQHVAQRGGRTHPRVTSEVNYVVVCDAGNPFWCISCYGRKVEQAVRRGERASRYYLSTKLIFGTHSAESRSALRFSVT